MREAVAVEIPGIEKGSRVYARRTTLRGLFEVYDESGEKRATVRQMEYNHVTKRNDRVTFKFTNG